MRELNVDLLETFKVEGLPDLADTSKSTVVAKLRCFLRDAFRRGWINEPLVERVRAHRAVYDQKQPYSDEEVEKILNEALNLNGGTHAYAKHPKTFRPTVGTDARNGNARWRCDPIQPCTRCEPRWTPKSGHTWTPENRPTE